MSVVELVNIGKEYEVIDGDLEIKTRALQEINIEIEENELTAIMGRSGSGKTTLLKILGIMDAPTAGRVFFQGEDVTGLSADELADIRNQKIGMVFQDYWLMDSLTVRENILLPMIIEKQKSEDEMKQILEKWVKYFELGSLVDKYPHHLSGGEKQRVSICRALVNNPSLFLADEPTGNLDTKSGEMVISAIKSIHKEFHVTVLIVTHDPKIACKCNQVLFLKDGELVDKIVKEESEEAFYNSIIKKQENL